MINKMLTILKYQILGAILIFTWIGTASATVINFDFNGLSIGTGTPITLTSSGVDATFSASGDPGGFQITSSFFSFPGNVIYTPGTSGQANEALDIAFSSPLSSFSGNFATNGPGPLSLTALSGGLGGSVVGVASVTGVVPSGFSFPEGTISFSGAAFDSIVLADATDPNFALGSFTVTSSTVPEPSSLALVGIGLAGLILAWRRQRTC